MNKELILKYKAEFNHWLNGGSLLSSIEVTSTIWSNVDKDHNWTFHKDRVYIINDEYVEFRKALAEGKTIEYSCTSLNTSIKEWKTIGINHKFTLPVQAYRIKPEEPQFKDGELCWFYSELYNLTVLGTYYTSFYGKYYNAQASDEFAFDKCEPFLNSKPSWFKDDL